MQLWHKSLLMLACMLCGCSSGIPAALREAPSSSPSLKQVQAQPEHFAAVRLRWGGTIVRIVNQPHSSELEIVSRPLEGDGKPKDVDHSEGRFLARVEGFLDPDLYRNGRSITVVGQVEGVETRPLDQMQYPYPLISVSAHHLWPLPPPCSDCMDPFMHDPWYPFGYPYPYHPFWPYYR